MPEDVQTNPSLSNPGLTGDADTFAGKRRNPGDEPDNWATRTHPDREDWLRAETRQRASYIATQDALSDFLVPHKTEKDDPNQLRRAKFGFGIGLNAMFVQSIMGHVRSAEASRVWGPLSTADDTESDRPEGGVGAQLWDDATLENDSWANLFNGQVLEWMLTSVGGWLLVDSSERFGRPKFRFFPWSAVEDYGWGDHGLRWIKFAEMRDVSTPRMEDEDDRFERRHLLYELNDSDEAVASRWNDDAEQIGDDIPIGELVDFQGQPTLPLVPVGFGSHPEIANVPAGLLLGLDDIVIDAYNQLSEVREAYRDFAFSVFAVKGPDGTVESIEESLKKDSYLLNLGDSENAQIERIGGTTPEVDQGLQVVDLMLKAWALSARRKSVEAMEGAQARSGVSLKAEFQLDEKPLLVTVAERMDEIESKAMFLAAQINDESFNAQAETAREIGVMRSTEFQMEEEASRIARIVEDFREGWSLVPARAKAEMVMAWLEATDEVDLGTEVEMGDGETRPLREVLPGRIEELASLSESRMRQRAELTSGGPLVRDGAAA